MGLFPADPAENLLPADGVVNYHGPIFSPSEAERYFAALQVKVPWQNDTAFVQGRLVTVARQVAWYGDAPYAYAYSGITKTAIPWSDELRELKTLIQERTGMDYNSCLANLYESGAQGVGWHSDDEPTLRREAAIASVSFGAERKFVFRHRWTKAMVSVVLESGSLLVMRGATQTHWQHTLPKTTTVGTPRVNLTFRSIASE